MSMAKIKTLLGFAQKSNNLSAGNEIVSKLLDGGAVKLILIGSDVSAKSVKNLKYKCLRLNIPVYEIMTTAQQSKAIGKRNRTVIGITDSGFAAQIINLISDMSTRTEVQLDVQN